MTGRILKGIGGFYYVDTGDVTYACKAKGIFRNTGQKPLVGDYVTIEITHEKDKEGNITSIINRKNSLIRPEAANVDQALVIFAVKNPDLNEGLLNRFLVTMEKEGVPVIICFNKTDLADDAEKERLKDIYQKSASYELCFTVAKEGKNIDKLKALLKGKTSIVAGPSGVGKSTMINRLIGFDHMETGELSRKLGRGKNTTRHSQLIALGENTYFCDTPGFTSLDLPEMEPEELQKYFPEFEQYEPYCRFQGCSHICEPDCGVREAVENGKIYQERYDNYCRFYEELREMKKRRY